MNLKLVCFLKPLNKYDIVEVPIKTIYDSKENHQTHFLIRFGLY